MKHFNCFVKYEGAGEKHSMFIQIPESTMNSYNPNSIRNKIKQEIAERHWGDRDFARITDVTILGCYED